MGDYDDSLFWDSMDEATVEKVLSVVEGEEITVSGLPKSGLVMLTVKDSFDTDFHLGEVLVTDARVTCCGVEGFGMVMGKIPESPGQSRRRRGASVCFILRVKERLVAVITEEQTERRRTVAAAEALVAGTRVNFDLI